MGFVTACIYIRGFLRFGIRWDDTPFSAVVMVSG
nr:MAG TPA: hypothetical protein [Bacteriophage sp.]